MMVYVVPADLIDRLYSLPPEQFVAARDEAVADARLAGDRLTATEIAALRRPTVAAWLVNLLVRQRADLVDELFELGESLRAAQQDLRGDELRELSTRRRTAIGGLVAEARRLALAAGRSGRENLPLASVEATLTAALAEPDVAAGVRAGTLTKAAGYDGFGETPRPRLRVIDGGLQPEPGPAGKTSQAGPTSGRSGDGRPGSASAEDRSARDGSADAGRSTRGGSAGRTPAPETSRDGSARDGRSTGAAAANEDRDEETTRGGGDEEIAAAARTRKKEIEAELRQAGKAEQDAARELADLTAQLDDLRDRQARAQLALRQARLRLKTAQRAAARIRA